MVESNKKNSKIQSSRFENDLDEILDEVSNDAAVLATADEEDLLDRLLMGESSDKSAESAADQDDFDAFFDRKTVEQSSPKSQVTNRKPEAKGDIDSLLDKVSDKVLTNNPKPSPAVEKSVDDIFDEIDNNTGGSELDLSVPDAATNINSTLTAKADNPPKPSREETVSEEELDLDMLDIFAEESETHRSMDRFDEVLAKTQTEKKQENKSVIELEDEFSDPDYLSPQVNSEEKKVPAVETAGIDAFDDEFSDPFEGSLDQETNPNTEQESEGKTAEALIEPVTEASKPSIEDIQNAVEEDEFLMADFDITADEDEFSSANLDDGISASPAVELESDSFEDTFGELGDFFDNDPGNSQAENISIQPQAELPTASANGPNLDLLLAQLAALSAAHEALKKQVEDTKTAEGSPIASFESELDALKKEQKVLRRTLESNANKKNPAIVYFAVALGVLGLLLSGGLFYLYKQNLTELDALKQHSAAVDNDFSILKNKGLASEGEDGKAAIAELSKQIETINSKLAGLDKPAPVAEPEHLAKTEKVPEKIVNQKEVMVNAQIPGEKPISRPDSPAPVLAPVVPVVEPVPVTPDTIRKAAVLKTPVKESANKTPEKKVVERPVKVIAAVEKKPKPEVEEIAEPQNSGKGLWGANLVSFRQDWYAKSKAEEFAQRGISVVIVPVEVKGETWYRLRAGGFANRTEANNYAAKAKRTLNLTSVWVTPD